MRCLENGDPPLTKALFIFLLYDLLYRHSTQVFLNMDVDTQLRSNHERFQISILNEAFEQCIV